MIDAKNESGVRAPHRKRCKRYNIPSHAHALTFSCFRRQAFLSRDRSCQWLADALERAREIHQFHIWAYVMMPEHAHVLLWPMRASYDISTILYSIKQSVVQKALLFVRKNAPAFLAEMEDRQPNGKVHYRFWQRGGGYDRNVVEPNEVYRQIAYIHENPVRRRLCQLPEDWLWSSAADYAGVRQGPVRVDREFLPVYRQEV